MDANELGVGRWVFEHGQPAGLGTATLPGAAALYVPLIGSTRTGRRARPAAGRPPRLDEPERLHLLETFAGQTALALERAQLAEEAQSAQVRVETERLRNSLLELGLARSAHAAGRHHRRGQHAPRGRRAARRPARSASCWSPSTRRPERLNRLVQNLLDMTRLESGAVQLRKEWHPLEEVVGAALGAPEQAAWPAGG